MEGEKKEYSLFGASRLHISFDRNREQNSTKSNIHDRLANLERGELLDLVYILREAYPMIDKKIKVRIESEKPVKELEKSVLMETSPREEPQLAELPTYSMQKSENGAKQPNQDSIDQNIESVIQKYSVVMAELETLEKYFKQMNENLALDLNTSILRNIYENHQKMLFQKNSSLRAIETQVKSLLTNLKIENLDESRSIEGYAKTITVTTS